MKTIKQIVYELRHCRFMFYIFLIPALSLVLLSCTEDNADMITPVPGSSLDMALESKINSGPSDPEILDLGFDLAGASGSTIGPGGDLFVTEGATGTIYRINVKKGEVSTFATGLPVWEFVGVGGAIDVVFMGEKAYALVTIVGLFTSEVAGIYEIMDDGNHVPIADLGAWSAANLPATDWFLEKGVQYAIEVYQGAFLVTDGHHNRVLHVTLDGEITEIKTFDNIVPTGLDIHGNTVYMAQAGPVDHLPEDGKVVSFGPHSDDVTLVASGYPLLVDVEFGRGQSLYALSQGYFEPGGPDGSPATPNSGYLVRVNNDGTFTELVDEIDRPTSMEIVGNTAYIVSLSGKIYKISNVGSTPFGF